MRIYQFSCSESKDVDLRQANAVLKYKPDVIIFEAPSNGRELGLIYNKFPPSKKPYNELKKYKSMLQRVSRKYPWVKSDIRTFENIATLWKNGHEVKLFNIDGPAELLRVNLPDGLAWDPKPYRRGTQFEWWVRIYLREKIMTRNIRKILDRYQKKEELTVLVFLQSFHWKNVQFQLTSPSQEGMWKYYFGSFKKIDRENITARVNQNRTLFKYWRKYSDFR